MLVQSWRVFWREFESSSHRHTRKGWRSSNLNLDKLMGSPILRTCGCVRFFPLSVFSYLSLSPLFPNFFSFFFSLDSRSVTALTTFSLLGNRKSTKQLVQWKYCTIFFSQLQWNGSGWWLVVCRTKIFYSLFFSISCKNGWGSRDNKHANDWILIY